MRIIRVYEDLAAELSGQKFTAPVAWVYNPVEYARQPHNRYLRRSARGTGKTLLLGMNPGPFGMAQTGVPFGDVAMVRDFLGINGRVDHPARQHAKKPVLGFECKRREVSGTRFWGWVQERWGDPDLFAEEFLVINYCPLLFMEEGGRNLTPDKLKPAERRRLQASCDAALLKATTILKPRMVLGIGRWACDRAQTALTGTGVPTGMILHPSPASPAANRGWAPVVEKQLREYGLIE